MPELTDQRTLVLHPEALFDEPYQRHPLDLSGYRTPERGETVVTGIGEWGLRIRVSAGKVAEESVTEQLGLTTIPAGPCPEGLRFVGEDGGAGPFSVVRADGTVLLRCDGVRFSPEPGEYSGERFVADFDLAPGEGLYGFGGRVAPVARRGQTADMYAVKTGRTTGDYGGFPVPWFVSSRGYGVFLNNPWPHVFFDLGATDPERWWVHAPGGAFDLVVIDGPAIPEVVRRFTELVGRIPVPQRWCFGFWTSALAFISAEEVEGVARRLRAEGYPGDAMVLDGPWRGGPEFLQKYMADGEYPTNDLDWHPDFGEGPGMVRRLAALGFRTVIHQNSRSWLRETIGREVPRGTIRVEGAESVVTFGTREGERFYAEALRPRHAEGIGCWWLDHGDRVGGELLSGIPSRNLFGAMWAKATRACGEADGVGSRLSLIRGACIGGQRGAIPWPGDTRFGIDFLLDDLRFVQAAGLSGFPVTSADLGGFMGATAEDPPYNTAYDLDNLARRLCQGMLVIPVPRMHQSDEEPPKLPWNLPPEVEPLYRRCLAERYALTPYYYSYAINAAATGDPIVRPLVYAYQDDPEVRAIEDELLIGDWLLAAPVCTKGAEEREVYLPAGTWYDSWTGERYAGGKTITAPAPLLAMEGLPLFVKAGAIIPKQEAVDHLEGPPSRLLLDLYPAGESRFVLLEEDGLETVFTCREGDAVELTIEGGLPERTYLVRVHGDGQLRINGEDVAPDQDGRAVVHL